MLADALDEDVLDKRLRRLADGYRKRFGDLLKYDVDEELARLKVCKVDASCSGSTAKSIIDPT